MAVVIDMVETERFLEWAIKSSNENEERYIILVIQTEKTQKYKHNKIQNQKVIKHFNRK